MLAAIASADAAIAGSMALVPLLVAAPLLASLSEGRRVTLGIGVLASALALVLALLYGSDVDQDAIRVATVALVAGLAVWTAHLRERLQESVGLLEVTFERAPVGLAFVDRELRYRRINDRLAAINGAPPLAHIGRRLDEMAPELPPEVGAALRRVVAVGEPVIDAAVSSEMPADPGTPREWIASYWPVHGVTGEVLGAGMIVFEVTAQRAAEAERERLLTRAAFLAEASTVFDETLDQSETLERVALLCLRLADTCSLRLGALGDPELLVTVARDPEQQAVLREIHARHPIDTRPDHPLLRAMREGRGLLVRSAGAEGLDVEPRDARHAELLRRVTGRIAIAVPLAARGRVLGSLGVAFDDLAEDDARGMIDLFEDVAKRAALALDTARLYQERAEVARTLQSSLLPPELPRMPGMALAARYLPAGGGSEVGGDFYDCFPLGNGSWALVIGDVCGKGAEAAAVTALARHTVRAAAIHTALPASVLSELNEAILRQGDDYRFCTVLYAVLTPDAGGMRAVLATGGHPLPLLLRASGRVETAGAPGTLLGIVPEPRLSEEEVLLGPGDALVLFTDGVVEASPHDDALGPQALARLLTGNAGVGAEGLADAVTTAARAVQHGPLRDDVAVLVAQVTGA